MDTVRNIETWGRMGFAARGLVYLLLGWIALSSGKALSTGETVQAVADLPLGTALLVALAVGLFGYGLFKLHGALTDSDDDGKDAKGRVVRIGRAIGGLAYWGLAGIAVRQLWIRHEAIEAGRAAGSDGLKQEAARQVGHVAGGGLLLSLIGAVIIGLAVAQFVIALRAKFMEKMARCPGFVRPTGRAGYLARGLVVALVGWFVLKAGIDGDRLRGFDDALALVRDSNPLLFKMVAAGLAAFGVTSLMMARYRYIRDDDVVDAVAEKVRR